MEFEIGPRNEHDFGHKDRPHKLQFHHTIDSHFVNTNIEFVTDDELRNICAKIYAYLDGLR